MSDTIENTTESTETTKYEFPEASVQRHKYEYKESWSADYIKNLIKEESDGEESSAETSGAEESNESSEDDN